MPLERCTVDGKGGWRWGTQGHCYPGGKEGKKAAILQGIAIEGPEKFKTMADEDPELGRAVSQELSIVELVSLSQQANAAKMTRKSIDDLPDSDFAYISPGGSKDSSGKTTPRSLRHLPIHDAAHVRNALARLSQTDIPAEAKKAALAKIHAAAKRFGIDSGDSGK